MKVERWTEEFLVRGSGITLAAQEKHLEEARRKGNQCLALLADPTQVTPHDVAVFAAAKFAARAALRARPDLCQPGARRV